MKWKKFAPKNLARMRRARGTGFKVHRTENIRLFSNTQVKEPETKIILN